MDLIQSKKTAWLSGEVCRASGNYYADNCGHRGQREFIANDIFPRCSICQQAIRWIRLNSNAIETQKTLSFSKRTDFIFSNPINRKA